jgi:hypothetical protein
MKRLILSVLLTGCVHPQPRPVATLTIQIPKLTIPDSYCDYDASTKQFFFVGPDYMVGTAPTCTEAFKEWNKEQSLPPNAII